MPRVVGIDHLVLSVGNFARSRDFYDKLLVFLGFKRKYDYEDMTGWSNGKTLFWIAAADAQGRKRKYRKGDIGFHHYAFELASRDDVDALGAFLDGVPMDSRLPPTDMSELVAAWVAEVEQSYGMSPKLGARIRIGLRRKERWNELNKIYRQHIKATLPPA